MTGTKPSSRPKRIMGCSCSTCPFCIGRPGWMWISATFQSSAQLSILREVNSGPLSERTFSGRPRSPINRSSTRVTRPLPRLVSASSARHSRVYASTTLRIRTIRPVARPSTMKSIAHSWLEPVSRGSAMRSRTRRLRLLRRTIRRSSTYSR